MTVGRAQTLVEGKYALEGWFCDKRGGHDEERVLTRWRGWTQDAYHAGLSR